MSNHYHLVLRVDKNSSDDWSESEVIRRWKQLCSIPQVITQYLKTPEMPGIDVVAQDLIESWRVRLTDISWLMRFLNEYLARKANEEDNCKGRFWDSFLRPAKTAYITSM